MVKESDVGVLIPEIMLPDGKINMKRWSVVACDQYTSEPDYWHNVQRTVGNSPSTYHLILPEAFINASDRSDRIAKIKSTMKTYVDEGILAQLPRGIVLVERTVGSKKRKGIMLTIDLEEYDFQPGNRALCRATERVVLERIPPRMEVRTGAILETPHAILLMNDPRDTVIGPLYKKRDSFYKLYGFDLMEGGGYLNGWFVDNEQDMQNVIESLFRLKEANDMLFAAGDGNHSLVTAKAVWEEAKENIPEAEREGNPLRYALVEVTNLYDPGLTFEPIHRVIFNVSPSVCINDLMSIINRHGYKARMIYSRTPPQNTAGRHILPFITKDTMGRIEIENPTEPLVTGTLQDILDEYLDQNKTASVDYIHGLDSFYELSKQFNSIGFKLPGIEKEDLFPFIYKYGILPQKCFSLGDAHEKRYYTECRLLVKLETEAPAEAAEPQAKPAPQEKRARVGIKPAAKTKKTPPPPPMPQEEEEPEDNMDLNYLEKQAQAQAAKSEMEEAEPKKKIAAAEEAGEDEITDDEFEDFGDEAFEDETGEDDGFEEAAEPAGNAPEAADEDFDDLDELDEDMVLHLDDEEEEEKPKKPAKEKPVKEKRSFFKSRRETHI